MDRLAVHGNGKVIKKNQEVYTFQGVNPKQVADLCDLWKGSVVEYSRRRGIVRVESDRLSFDLFCTFYELYEYLENYKPVDMPPDDLGSHHSTG